jgi:hypothetical protein
MSSARTAKLVAARTRTTHPHWPKVRIHTASMVRRSAVTSKVLPSRGGKEGGCCTRANADRRVVQLDY